VSFLVVIKMLAELLQIIRFFSNTYKNNLIIIITLKMKKLKLFHILEKNIHSEIQTVSRTYIFERMEKKIYNIFMFSDRSMVENRRFEKYL
jgi:hypothetical protein